MPSDVFMLPLLFSDSVAISWSISAALREHYRRDSLKRTEIYFPLFLRLWSLRPRHRQVLLPDEGWILRKGVPVLTWLIQKGRVALQDASTTRALRTDEAEPLWPNHPSKAHLILISLVTTEFWRGHLQTLADEPHFLPCQLLLPQHVEDIIR